MNSKEQLVKTTPCSKKLQKMLNQNSFFREQPVYKLSVLLKHISSADAFVEIFQATIL